MEIFREHSPTGHTSNKLPCVDDDGRVVIDPWWGTIQPASLHPSIPTIGELEVIEHIESGGRLIDTRLPEYVEESGTLPTAVAIPARDVAEHLELFADGVTVLYCNGPQCAATPIAVKRLLEAGVAPEKLAYYRGGLQDWVGLGLPVQDP